MQSELVYTCVSPKDQKKKGAESIFKEIMAKNFPNQIVKGIFRYTKH
jgi:hypothetical protein